MFRSTTRTASQIRRRLFRSAYARLASTTVCLGSPSIPTASVHNSYSSRSRYSTSLDKPIQYAWVDGVERLEMYRPGGYHPVMVGDLLGDHYRIVDKLGYGGYSTVWLAHDNRLARYVAIKVNVSNAAFSKREAGIIRALSLSNPARTINSDTYDTIPSILDEFNVQGPNGTHACYVMAPTQGNLKEASFSRLFPIQVARALAAKMATAVEYVHSRGFVHGDIHLRNALGSFHQHSMISQSTNSGTGLASPRRCRFAGWMENHSPSTYHGKQSCLCISAKKAQEFTLEDARGLFLSDFGEAFAPATERRLGRNCNTPVVKRAPETFEPHTAVSFPSDVWSLGTTIWEILGMKFIFSESETVDEIVAQQIDVLGPHNFPPAWREAWERTAADTDEDIPRRPAGDRETWPPLEEAFEEFVQKYRRKQERLGTFEKDETAAILDLMRGMLKFRPEDRLTMEKVLKSRWMVQWALPQLEEATIKEVKAE